jgi:hypothetical protein
VLGEHEITVASLQREGLTQIFKRDLHREALKPLALGPARPAHQNSTPSESTAAWRSASLGKLYRRVVSSRR